MNTNQATSRGLGWSEIGLRVGGTIAETSLDEFGLKSIDLDARRPRPDAQSLAGAAERARHAAAPPCLHYFRLPCRFPVTAALSRQSRKERTRRAP